jgi:hypothetical protein
VFLLLRFLEAILCCHAIVVDDVVVVGEKEMNLKLRPNRRTNHICTIADQTFLRKGTGTYIHGGIGDGCRLPVYDLSL